MRTLLPYLIGAILVILAGWFWLWRTPYREKGHEEEEGRNRPR